MATLAEVRAKFPQYSDLNDEQLLDGLHRRFYADMPRDEFEKRVGFKPPVTVAETASDVGMSGLRGFNKGLADIASLPYRGVDWVGEKLTGGDFLPNVETLPGWRYYLNPEKPKTQAGRFADQVGQAVGSSAIPQAGLMVKAGQMAGPAAQTALGQVGQQMVAAARANPGRVLAADTAAAVGSGTGQQAAQEGGFGPVGQTIGAVAGAVAPSAIGATAQRVVQPIQRAYANQGRAGAYGSIATDLPQGVDALADQVAVGATRANQQINRRTLDILGEEMERAGGNVQQAQAAAIQRISQEYNVAPATAARNIRALTEPHAESQLLLGEYPAVAASDAAQRMRQPGNTDLDTLGRTQASTTQAKLDYLANNGSAQSAQNVRNAIGDRQEALAPAMRNTLEAIGPQVQHQGGGAVRPATIADSAQMIEQARQAGSQAYHAAYNGPINTGELVHRLPRVLQAADNYAATRSGDISSAIRRATDQFYVTTPQGQRIAMMTLQQLQDARGVVRGQIAEYTRAGRNDLVRAVQPFYERITQIMERASPLWGQANRQWADMNFLRIGEDLGDAFATRAGPQFREQMAEFRRLAPQAQDIVRIHFLQKLYDKLDNLGDTHAVSKLFTTDHSRNMIGALLGDEAAVTFARAVRDQRVAEASGRMMANSATHRRGMAQKQMDAETGLIAAVENANMRGVRNWIVERMTQMFTERRNRPMADILTTPMSDTARVAQHLYNMRQQQQRLSRYANPPARQNALIGIGAPVLGENDGR